MSTVFITLQQQVLLILFLRKKDSLAGDLKNSLDAVHQNLERSERMVREEIARNRQELQLLL